MARAFGLFMDDGKGPLWRDFFDNLEEAKRQGQNLASVEDHEFFIFSFEANCEVERFFPASSKTLRPGA